MSVDHNELQKRLLIALLNPVARLALRFEAPVKYVRELTELMYYREARRKELKHEEIQQIMDVGMSKVASLSKRLKATLGAEQTALGLERRIIMLLWAQPLTATKICNALDDTPEDQVTATLERMVEQKRLEHVEGRTLRYALTSGRYRLVEDRWVARFEALNSFTRTVQTAIEARFLDDDPDAFVRNLRFHVRDADRPRLRKLYEEALFPLVNELEEASQKHGDGRAIQLALVWANDPESDEDHERSSSDD